MMNKKTLFISDLHLDERYPDITARFSGFIDQLDESVDALYILGDFFNAWVGDDDVSPFHSKIQSALKKASQRCPVYFLPGNRDFLIGKQFAEQTGCVLLKDPAVVDLYGVPTLLMHGDSLCKNDVQHLRFRAFSQHPLIKYLFLKLPLNFRKKVAQELRRQSRQHLSSSAKVLWQIEEAEVCRVMLQFRVNQMIHGHTHSHLMHSVPFGDRQGQRVVLGDWEDSGSILVCEPDPALKAGFLTKNTLVRFSG